ncbi:hypothetical protein CesoFtcFv8_023918 [Champsocephalus esox]|uniref:Uncharacterized protein n=1 Tax=Champsocephalus esox TaxID=159716 RepID=A0AAN8B5T2_9TELE|nr:hypothetical protein CesoFtcFv8_023918 [Champsocephalus esox]
MLLSRSYGPERRFPHVQPLLLLRYSGAQTGAVHGPLAHRATQPAAGGGEGGGVRARGVTCLTDRSADQSDGPVWRVELLYGV